MWDRQSAVVHGLTELLEKYEIQGYSRGSRALWRL